MDGDGWSDQIQCSVCGLVGGAQRMPKTCHPHHYTTGSLNCWYKAEWIDVFTLFVPNSDLTIQMLKHVFLIFWCPGMVSLVGLQPHFYVISWQKWHHKAFSPRKLLLSGWFLFFRPFSINPRDACVGKSQQISSFCNSSPSSPTTMPRSRSLKSAFSCILMPCLNFSRSSWLCRRAWGPAKRLAG